RAQSCLVVDRNASESGHSMPSASLSCDSHACRGAPALVYCRRHPASTLGSPASTRRLGISPVLRACVVRFLPPGLLRSSVHASYFFLPFFFLLCESIVAHV